MVQDPGQYRWSSYRHNGFAKQTHASLRTRSISPLIGKKPTGKPPTEPCSAANWTKKPLATFGLHCHRGSHGGAGNDFIAAGTGADTVHGGTGMDRIYGMDKDDILFGYSGNDVIYGDGNNDQLIGDADRIPLAEQSNDRLDGGAGDDALLGGAANDNHYPLERNAA